MKKWLLIFLLMLTNVAIATPKAIIIIRHGDKLDQPQPGPALSAKGQVRAVKFAFYYLEKFGEPDFVFAPNPNSFVGKNSSIRELQTVAPLINMLSRKHPETGFPILHPYENADFKKLASYVLKDKMFNDKTILICWSHKKIPQLAEKLGIKQSLPQWQAADYDSVYVIKYDNEQVSEFTILNNQYPVNFNGNWKGLKTPV